MPPTATPPWLGLPDHLAEQILERLPLSDYLRFPAVCRRWRSLQSNHRRRHAPSPPPMVKLPWLIPGNPRQEIVPCYSPFEGRTYCIKIPSYSDCFPNCGWLFLPDSIFNPISGIDISFPEPPFDENGIDIVAVSPPPGPVIFVVINPRELSVCRPGDPRWTKLKLPIAKGETVTDAVTLGGRLYCIFSCYERPTADHLLIVDTVPTPPTVCSYRMEDWAKILPLEKSVSVKGCRPIQLVESDGEILMVKKVIDKLSGSTLRFHVLRPDVSKRMWTRVESLGHRLLLFHSVSLVSLIAVDVGLKKNCIYFRDDNWNVFDLDVGVVMDTPFPDDWLLGSGGFDMFLPSVC